MWSWIYASIWLVWLWYVLSLYFGQYIRENAFWGRQRWLKRMLRWYIALYSKQSMSTHTSTNDSEPLHQIKECKSQYNRSLVSASCTFVDSSCHLDLTPSVMAGSRYNNIQQISKWWSSLGVVVVYNILAYHLGILCGTITKPGQNNANKAVLLGSMFIKRQAVSPKTARKMFRDLAFP